MNGPVAGQLRPIDPPNAGQSYLGKRQGCRNWRRKMSNPAMRDEHRDEQRHEHEARPIGGDHASC